MKGNERIRKGGRRNGGGCSECRANGRAEKGGESGREGREGVG